VLLATDPCDEDGVQSEKMYSMVSMCRTASMQTTRVTPLASIYHRSSMGGMATIMAAVAEVLCRTIVRLLLLLPLWATVR